MSSAGRTFEIAPDVSPECICSTFVKIQGRLPTNNVIGNRQWTSHLVFITNNHYGHRADLYLS